MQNITLALLFLLACPFQAFAQSSNARKADSLFAEKQYAKALSLYQTLEGAEKNSITRLYQRAVCLVEASPNRQDDAIDILERLCMQPTAPRECWFYLGDAYRKLYQFERAAQEYSAFLSKVPTDNSLYSQAELYIGCCKNGLQLLENAHNPQGRGKKAMPPDRFYSIYDTFSAGYPAEKPKTMLMSADLPEKEGSGNVVFFPEEGTRRNAAIIFFSSYGEDASSGLDIYCIYKEEDGSWSEPLNLGPTINTPFDEAYPYISADGKTLYFASKGHYGMGGYDIYRCKFDENIRSWSTPENLGFPFSSPYDDFFFVPSANGQYACFASTRESEDESLTVYKVELEPGAKVSDLRNSSNVLSIALLTPTSESTKTALTPQATAKNEGIEVGIKSLAGNEDYLALLRGAKFFSDELQQHQAKLDKLRDEYLSASEEGKKELLEKQIISEEQEMELIQLKLDDFQATISQAEYEFLTNRVEPVIPMRLTRLLPAESVEESTSATLNDNADVANSSFGNVYLDERPAPAINMKQPTAKESERYKFKTTGKSLILHNEPVPAKGVTYKIRIGIYSQDPTEAQLKNLSPITTEKRGASKRYYVGMFKLYSEATKALGEVKKKGFKDALIDAWVNGKPEQVARAREAEKRLANEGSTSQQRGAAPKGYRVVVTASAATSANVPAILSSLSGERDILKKVNSDGSTTYSVGIFSKIGQANELKEQLAAKGISDVEVTPIN